MNHFMLQQLARYPNHGLLEIPKPLSVNVCCIYHKTLLHRGQHLSSLFLTARYSALPSLLVAESKAGPPKAKAPPRRAFFGYVDTCMLDLPYGSVVGGSNQTTLPIGTLVWIHQ